MSSRVAVDRSVAPASRIVVSVGGDLPTANGLGRGACRQDHLFDDNTLHLDEIDTDCSATDDVLAYAIDDVIAIEWGDVYLDALTELNTNPTPDRTNEKS